MGIFGNLFGGGDHREKGNDSKVPWIPLTDVHQLKEIKEKSASRPQVIFKHSTTCGVSRMVLNRFTQNYALEEEQMDLYFLDLHQNRALSNQVSNDFGVRHESPQLLVIKNGEVIAHNSHGGIANIQLEEFV